MTSWAVGVTTIHSRLETYLPETLVSLKAGGFGNPRLFVDGAENCGRFIDHEFSLEATLRRPRIGAYGNWLLGLWELYLRNPTVDRYAMFQDDVVFDALALGIVDEEQSALLRRNYFFLRRIESVLRRAENTNVSRIPVDDREQLRLAKRLGFTNTADFLRNYRHATRKTRELYDQLLPSS